MNGAMRIGIVLVGLGLVAACGGGGGGSSSSGTTVGNGTIEVPAGVCGSDLYQEIIGTYRGRVSYDRVLEDGSLEPRCVWDMTARVVVDQDVVGCGLELALDAPVEQPIVLDSSERTVFQCMGSTGLRTLVDPNGFVDPADLQFISFPLDFRVLGSFEPATGPYFGDENVTAFYTRLFDSSSAIVDVIRFAGDGTMELVQAGPTTSTRLSSVLNKEEGNSR